MWTIDEVQRAGTIILIFYFIDEDWKEGQDKTIYVRGQITCNDRAEVDLWQTVLTTLNSTNE